MLELQASDSSNVNALALIFLTIVSFIVLYARPQYAVGGLLLTALFIPLGQQFVIAGLHFRFFRVLILIGLCRVVSRGELRKVRQTGVDNLIVAWTLLCLMCGILRGVRAEMFGGAYDVLGSYYIFRALIPTSKDLTWQLRVFCVASIVVAACMAVELLTTRNPFFVFGGVPEFTLVREGRFRCQGPFRHPILAGTFAATLFPILVGYWQSQRRSRTLISAGIVSSIFATYVAASSGALITLMMAVGGLAMWPFRRWLRVIRYAVLIVVIETAVLMEAPIWYLIAKVSGVSGGTGWHRSYIIDQAVSRIDEWWLIGSSYTAHWAHNPHTILAVDPDNMDITNHYIQQGLKGGLVGLGLFLAVVIGCFKLVGRAMREEEQFPRSHRIIWALGTSFAAHCAAFVSVSYFDQMMVFWVWLVAVIVALRFVPTRKPLQLEKAAPITEPSNASPVW